MRGFLLDAGARRGQGRRRSGEPLGVETASSHEPAPASDGEARPPDWTRAPGGAQALARSWVYLSVSPVLSSDAGLGSTLTVAGYGTFQVRLGRAQTLYTLNLKCLGTWARGAPDSVTDILATTLYSVSHGAKGLVSV